MSTLPITLETVALPSSLRVASFNASGLNDSRLDFCVDLLSRHNIDVLLVQETFWTKETPIATKSSALLLHLPFNLTQDVDSGDGSAGQKRKRTRTPHGLAILIGSRLLPFKAQIRVIHMDQLSQATITISVGKVQITNVYLPPSMNTDQWTSVLHAIPDAAPSGQTVHVLLGDWNVRLGEQTGDTGTNSRATGFTEIVQSRSLAIVPFAAETPTFLDRRDRTSIPDFVLVSSEHLTMCSAVTVLDRDNSGSDHFPIMVDVNCDSLLNTTASPEGIPVLNPRRIATHLLEKSKRIRRVYSEEVNASLQGILVRCQRTWGSVRNNPQARVETAWGLLNDLTDSFLSSLVSSAERHCKSRKRDQGLSKSALSGDTVLTGLKEQRMLLLRQLRMCSPVEDVRIPLRDRLKGVNRGFDKRAKVLSKQSLRNQFDDLEAKSLKEQQRMIRFERNKSQRCGAKMLDHERLPDYSRHFASTFNFSASFVYGESSSDATAPNDLNAKVRILSKAEFATVNPFFSTPNMEHFILKEQSGKAAGCSRCLCRAHETSCCSSSSNPQSGGRNHVLHGSLSRGIHEI